MKVSEKSLESNVAAELLGLLRGSWRLPKAYLRGLPQREEKQASLRPQTFSSAGSPP